MRVKICGITSAEDAERAARAGADAIGLNFVSGPRQVEPAAAAAILANVPVFVTPVALVTLQDTGDMPGDVLELLGRHWVSCVQLYGRVDAETVIRTAQDGFKPLVVGHVRDRAFAGPITALLDACGEYRPAGIVLDAFDPERLGGTGEPFHWPWLAEARQAGELDGWPPIVLAGGLHPENVAEAVTHTRPWGIDVASGVESAPGRKDFDKMQALIQAARAAAHN